MSSGKMFVLNNFDRTMDAFVNSFFMISNSFKVYFLCPTINSRTESSINGTLPSKAASNMELVAGPTPDNFVNAVIDSKILPCFNKTKANFETSIIVFSSFAIINFNKGRNFPLVIL